MEVARRLLPNLLCLGGVVLSIRSVQPPAAQEDGELVLTLRRTFGFRGGDQIQGQFRLGVEGPSDLVRVTFTIDGQVLAVDLEPPFEHDFRTGDYPFGPHTLAAVGTLSSGRELRSPDRVFEFLSAEAGWAAAGKIVAPLLAGVFALMLAGTLGPTLLGRKRTFHLGDYGRAGGAICPHCRLPFSRGFWSPNLMGRKLERCPHCSRWSWVPRASDGALAGAEARFRQVDSPSIEPAPDRRSRQIEESRYET